MKFDLSTLDTGVLIGVTDYISPLSATIRRVQAGHGHAFDFRIPSHVLIAISPDVGIEMGAFGIRLVDIQKYTRWPNKVIYTAVHPLFKSSHYARAKGTVFLLELNSLQVAYGKSRLLKHLRDSIKDRGGWICSDLYMILLREFDISFPAEWCENTSPLLLQAWNGHEVTTY